jgi:hypothetical protein
MNTTRLRSNGRRDGVSKVLFCSGSSTPAWPTPDAGIGAHLIDLVEHHHAARAPALRIVWMMAGQRRARCAGGRDPASSCTPPS